MPNTLFNYFSRQSGGEAAKADGRSDRGKENGNEGGNRIGAAGDGGAATSKRKKSIFSNDPMNDEEQEDLVTQSQKSAKRRRLKAAFDSSSDEEDNCDDDHEYKPTEYVDQQDKPKVQQGSKIDLKNMDIEDGREGAELPVNALSVKDFKESNDEDGNVVAEFAHLNFDFVNRPKDSKGRDANDEEYDPSSLRVPNSFLEKQTPAQRQWWVLKSQHFDTVLFFKMGKFYELFHMDAVLAVKECSLTFMKKDYAHCGFPEVAFERFANVLVDKGFKVARIEQVETPKMMEARCKKLSRATKFDKVVRRTVQQKVSLGTRTFSHKGEDFLIACYADGHAVRPKVGICVLNASLSRLYLGGFEDDGQFTRAAAAVAASVDGPEIIFPRNSDGAEALARCLSSATGAKRRRPVAKTDVRQTLEMLRGGSMFGDGGQLPEEIKAILNEAKSDEPSPAIVALCLAVQYLKEALIDKNILSYGDIHTLDALVSPVDAGGKAVQHMTMQGNTIRNLDIVPISLEKENRGFRQSFSLFHSVNHTCTHFGRRLLRQWLCSPLYNPEDIKERQDSLKCLQSMGEEREESRRVLKTMPDFERFMAWIFAASCDDSTDEDVEEAIFYEKDNKTKANIKRLANCLEGFVRSLKLVSELASKELALSKALVFDDALLQEASEHIDSLKGTFDLTEASAKGTITPVEGVSSEYDAAADEFKQVEAFAESYRREQCAFFGRKIHFFGSGPNAYQLEVPDGARKPSSDHVVSSKRKGFSRFLTPTCYKIREDIDNANEKRRSAEALFHRAIFRRFSSGRAVWRRLVRSLATLDCLLSLHDFSYSLETAVFPRFESNRKPFLRIRDGKHPLLLNLCSSVIPNDLDVEHGKVVLLTGANMGGKSTVMRLAATMVVLAQVGAMVPAQEMSLTPVDKLFTRMGANDNMADGESTFLVELSETVTILDNATPNSLVLLDELGRGTSTHDGCAIALAVTRHLASEEHSCRVIFTTHYHQMVALAQREPGLSRAVMPCHMSMIVGENDITFLYKLSDGACPKSHGFNAARKAGVLEKVVAEAAEVASKMEKWSMAVEKVKAIADESY